MKRRKISKKAGARRGRRVGPRTRKRSRRNPHGVVIGDSVIDLRYEGGDGKRKGRMRGPWKHVFESNDVEVRGKKDGSIELRSKSGERLWDFFEV